MAGEAPAAGNPGGPCYRRSPEMELVDLDRDTVVYDRGHSKVYVLNRSAAAILTLCDGSVPDVEMARRLAAEFQDAPDQGVLDDVKRTLQEFQQLGIVTQG